ncbi:MAG TPA: polyprenyl synthetase family protein [Candidatus Baltobacteraceae bacterium]|nr:polyprenyl synthetase family protein [Candidatus Baltobacteraceae bacterium]
MIDALRSDGTDLYALVESFFRERFSTDNALITEAVRRMLAAGGKRLRPRVTLLATAACGGDPARHLQLAAYMELIHVATLIHDDVVDNAQTRRGVNATAVDFGNRVSVLAGDYLFAWIFKNVTAGYPHPIPNILSSTLADICDGEVLQLRALGDLDHALDAYVEVARKKTASLFAASAACGAIVGGGDQRTVDALRSFGESFGIAFQMNDDLLDMTGDAQALGKPVGNDLTERKMTIPVVLALREGDPAFRELLARFYAGTSNDALASIVEAIATAGGMRATRAAVATFVERAQEALKPLPESAAKHQLNALAGALISSE